VGLVQTGSVAYFRFRVQIFDGPDSGHGKSRPDSARPVRFDGSQNVEPPLCDFFSNAPAASDAGGKAAMAVRQAHQSRSAGIAPCAEYFIGG